VTFPTPAPSAFRLRLLLSAVCLLAMMITISTSAHAQGCVAAHSNQGSMDELCAGGAPTSNGSGWIHRLTVDVGYRFFNSNKYFIGTKEIERPNAVRNHQNIFDIGINYQLTPQWSLIADIPIFDGTRNQIYPPSGIFQVSGLGDIFVGVQRWMFHPPTESNGTIAFSVSLKAPTGINNANGAALYKGQTILATADQSLQPGDGGWGFQVGSQAYKQIPLRTLVYFQGQWLFNPENTNGVKTFRSQPGQSIMSVTDQYLFRAGISHAIPRIRRLSGSIGARWEGVPAHDVIGASDGFRRPGYIISLDPGIMYSYRRNVLSVNGPWALKRNREPSVPEIQNNIWNGDAFFADYTVLISLSHHF